MDDKWMVRYAMLWPIGLSPVAPGTCASLAAIIAAPFVFMPLGFSWRLIMLCAIYYTGVRCCDQAERALGEKDPKSVVIDELFGQWMVLLPFYGLMYWELAAAFVLFRIFDIYKPWPVSAAEKIPGGTGIMVDDLAAALYAMICLAGVRWIGMYNGWNVL